MSKPKQVTTSTNTWGKWTPDKEEIAPIKDYKFADDPSIGYRYGKARRDIEEGMDNPLGPYTTPEMREQSKRSRLNELTQSEGQERADESYRKNMLQYQNLLDYVDRTKSQPLQTGSTQTATGGGGLGSSIIGGAASVGSALLM